MRTAHGRLPSLVVTSGLLLAMAACGRGDATFRQDQTLWRASRDLEMRGPESWLSIVGLFWLEEGETAFGTDPTCPIHLPTGTAPGRAGTFVRTGDEVKVRPVPGVELVLDGRPLTGERLLGSDRSGHLDELALGRLRLWLIQRGDRIAVRLRDREAPPYLDYSGLEFFPMDPEWRIQAGFVPHDPARVMRIATEVGIPTEYPNPGYLAFRVAGQDLTLEAFTPGSNPRELFILFKDATSGSESYGSGRFLYARLGEDGTVELDFNKAFNPPCAFTAWATCPLPPPQNILPVRIEAGEKKYRGGDVQ